MNGLELVQKAAAEWRKNRGGQSTYLKCQHFDGWYVQYVGEGMTKEAEKSIAIYPTALAASRASKIFTKDFNDKRIVAGDRVYWDWGTKGHVATVVGRDGKRLLVSHTSFSGDVVKQLNNNVRISHADTIGLELIGVSHQNGSNEQLKGIDMWLINQPASGGKPASGGSKPATPSSIGSIDLRDGWAWYKSAGDAKNEHNPHGPRWTGEQLARGVYPVLKVESNGAYKLRANDGSTIYVSPKAKHRYTPKKGAAAPVKVRKITFDGGRAWYTSANNAKNEWNPHGPRWTGEQYLQGTYDILKVESNGSLKIRAKDGSTVWVSPRALPRY